jgi:hypothetical protein
MEFKDINATLVKYHLVLKEDQKKSQEIIFYKYVFRHQTYADLALEYGKTKRSVYKQIHNYEVSKKDHNSRAVTLVCDTTFYGKRKDKLATVVFYDSIENEVLLWKNVDSEKSKYYKKMLQELLSLGYTINAVAIDGKRGLNTVFKGYPIQMCHFHQKKIVDRYITKNPKLEASIELLKQQKLDLKINCKNGIQNMKIS